MNQINIHTYIHTYLHTERHTNRHAYSEIQTMAGDHKYKEGDRGLYRNRGTQKKTRKDIYIHTYIQKRDRHSDRQASRHIG